MAEAVLAMAGLPVSAVPGQAGAPDTVREVDELAALLAGVMSGHGYRRGASTDPAVLARRLVESERVRVDVPGRLTVDQVVTLALRCGRSETALSEERLRRAVDQADVERLRAEVAGEASRVHELEAALRRVSAVHGQALGPILAEVRRG